MTSIALYTDLPIKFAKSFKTPLGKAESDFFSDSSFRQRIIAASENFVAAFSLGPLQRGHVLIVPVGTATSIGEVLNRPELSDEFLTFAKVVEEHLRTCFRSEICRFEHGSAGVGSMGCSVTQAHLHLLPLSMSVSDAILNDSAFDWKDVDGIEATRFSAAVKCDYLYLEFRNPTSPKLAIIPNPRDVPPQHLRRVLAGAIGVANWDWRKHPQESELIASSSTWNSYVSKCKDKVDGELEVRMRKWNAAEVEARLLLLELV